MSSPCIITVAITGSVPRKKDNPAVPISISEQIESTHEAYEAGATLVHLHVRDEQENSSSDRTRFAKLQEGIHQHCPGMIVQFSTGGRGRSFEQRGAMLDLRPDMASLATGSVNFPTTVYENPPDFVRSLAASMLEHDVKPEIEVFDLAMLYSTVDLVEQGLLKAPVHVQFVMGVKNALPARREILEFEVPVSAATNSKSTTGPWRWADTAAPVLKTTSAGTRTPSRPATRNWSHALPRFVPSTGVLSRVLRKRVSCWV